MRRTRVIADAAFVLVASVPLIVFWMLVLATVLVAFGLEFESDPVMLGLAYAPVALGPLSAYYVRRRLRAGWGAALRGFAGVVAAAVVVCSIGALLVAGNGPGAAAVLGASALAGLWWLRRRARGAPAGSPTVVHRPVGPLDAAPRPGRPLDARAAVDLPGTPLVEVAAEDLARCRDVVREFEAVRERYRGRLAAPISELADDRDRVVDAIVVVAGTSGLARRRELVADLVDLVTFVDPADAGLLEAYQRSASGGLALRESDLARAKRLLEALQVARATLAQQLRDDISVFGDLVALGEKPILIGDGRAALDAVRDYREGQLVGFLGAYVVIGGAAVAFLLDAAWFVALLAGWLGSVVGALAAVGIGGRVDRLLRSRTGIDSPFHRTIDTIRTGVVLVIGLGVPVGVMVAAVALT